MPLRAALRYCTLRYPLSPLRGQQQIIKNKRWMLSTREWLTFLQPIQRRANGEQLRFVMMLRSPRAAPMFLVLRTPFATSAWGGRYVFATSSMPSCSTGFASPYKHTLRVFSCCLRLDKTRGFRFTIQAHQGCLHRSRTCRDDFLHIGAELAEMTLYKCDATLTKSRSDVSRNILCQVAQPCVSPSLISLRTYLMVADTLTKSCSDVSSPKDAFHNICLGGQICIRNIVDAKLLNRASPSPISRGGDCLHARHLLFTQKAPLRYDATLPTPAPMFLVLRTRFATSACITMSTNPVCRKSHMRVHYCPLVS